jgi:hypothetical protein
MSADPTREEILGRLPSGAPGEPEAEPELELPAPALNGEPPSSLIAALREQHRRIGERKSVVLELPGFDGKLAARYHYLDERSLKRVLRLIQQSDDPGAILQANTDLLIGGCEEILARRTDEEEWGPLVDGEVIRYDERLGELLGFKTSSAREVVWALFHGRIRGALAIGAHSQRYVEWLQGQASEVAEDLTGESPSAEGS